MMEVHRNVKKLSDMAHHLQAAKVAEMLPVDVHFLGVMSSLLLFTTSSVTGRQILDLYQRRDCHHSSDLSSCFALIHVILVGHSELSFEAAVSILQ